MADYKTFLTWPYEGEGDMDAVAAGAAGPGKSCNCLAGRWAIEKRRLKALGMWTKEDENVMREWMREMFPGLKRTE